MPSASPRFFDRLQTSSLALRNSIYANRVFVTMEIYTSSLRSHISCYKATPFGRVHVLIPQNKTSLLRFCTYSHGDFRTRALYCTKSQHTIACSTNITEMFKVKIRLKNLVNFGQNTQKTSKVVRQKSKNTKK